MAMPKKVFKPLRLSLSSIPDADARHKLEVKFEEFNFLRAQANEATRKAAIADADSIIAMQQARKSFIQLLLDAGEYLDPIKVEQMWAVFRKDGDIVFECPFSEQDMRAAMKVQRAQMEQQAKQLGEGGEDDLYQGEDEPNQE